MRARNDLRLFDSMRKSRSRRLTLKGDMEGFRAAKHVWTCSISIVCAIVAP